MASFLHRWGDISARNKLITVAKNIFKIFNEARA